MYSNWLTPTPIPPPPPPPAVTYYPGNNILPPPDVLLEIGSPSMTARFWAHSQIICQCSGYLRSAVATNLANQRDFYHMPDKSVLIHNVSMEQFQPLLRYMYSGYLDLTMDNIFGVLLATHVLHMPHALEICRAFLSQMQDQGIMPTAAPEEEQPTLSTKQIILKPIPNKAKQVSVVEQQTIISAPSAPHTLLPSSQSTFQSPGNLTAKESQAVAMNGNQPRKTPHSANSHCETLTNIGNVGESRTVAHSPTDFCGKVVLDIASCDGPVRFRRVVNKFYSASSDPYRTTNLPTNSSSRILQLSSSSFHQQMAKDISERHIAEETSSMSNSQDADHPSQGTFRCAVCKHSFKSEYCYLKHSKRHLIPLVDPDTTPQATRDATENSAAITSLTQPPSALKRPVCKSTTPAKVSPNHIQTRDVIRPLDMNVQYYPCKTCGSKFPSYYFVHKHRKLCHQQQNPEGETADEESESREGDNSQENSPNPNSSSKHVDNDKA